MKLLVTGGLGFIGCNFILKILNDKDLAEGMGKHGKKFVQDTFNWDVGAKKFLDILNSNLGK